MSKKEKPVHVGEREKSKVISKKGLIKCSDNYTTESVGMGISYLGKGVFSVPILNGLTVTGYQELSLKEERAKLKCQDALEEALETWIYPRLNRHQEKIIRYIFKRTIKFFKTAEVIPQSYFLNGVFNADTGCDISDKGNLSRAIKKLLERGFIQREKHGSLIRKEKTVVGTVFSINFNALNQWVKETRGGVMKTNIVSIDFTDDEEDFVFSQKSTTKVLSNVQPDSCQKYNQKVVKSTTHNTLNNTSNNTLNKISEAATSKDVASLFMKNASSSNGDLPSSSAENGEKPESRSRYTPERRELILSKREAYTTVKGVHRISAPKAVEYFTFFARENYPNRIYAFPPAKVMGSLKRAITTTEFPEGDFLDFLAFTVIKWDTVRVQHFEFINRGRSDKGMDEIHYPDAPELGFVLSFKKYFFSAYQKECNARLSAVDLYADRLRAKGMSEAQVKDLTTKKIESDCDYEKARADYFKGLQNLEEERELLKMQRKSMQDEVQKARSAVYVLKCESDKEEKRLASLRACQMPQNTFSTSENVLTFPAVQTPPPALEKTDWNGMDENSMQDLAQLWLETYVPDFVEYTPEFFEQIFMKEFSNKNGDISFLYNALIHDGGSFYDRRSNLRQFDKEYAILTSSGDEAGLKSLQEFFWEDLTPGFKRFSESE